MVEVEVVRIDGVVELWDVAVYILFSAMGGKKSREVEMQQRQEELNSQLLEVCIMVRKARQRS